MYTIGVDGRVLHGPRTGTGWYTAGLLQELARRSDVRLKLLLYPGDPRGPADVSDLGDVEVWNAGAVASRSVALAARTSIPVGLDRVLPNCDAYLFPNYRRNAVRRGVTVTVVYDLAFRRVPDLVNPAYRRHVRRSAEDAIRHSDLIVTPSEQIRTEISDDYGRDPASVVAVLPGPRHSAAGAWAPAPTSHSRSCILHVGTLEPRKGIETLLAAHLALAEGLRETFPLTLAGKFGWRGPANTGSVKEADSVHWLGYVPDKDLPKLYASSAVLVTTSRYEGLGLPVLEALACGLPVVCSDIPSHREVCGDAALYFPAGDVGTLRAVLTDLLATPERRRRLAEVGRERATRFSWKDSVDGLLKRLTSLSEERSASRP